jgi:hypothetical protein
MIKKVWVKGHYRECECEGKSHERRESERYEKREHGKKK